MNGLLNIFYIVELDLVLWWESILLILEPDVKGINTSSYLPDIRFYSGVYVSPGGLWITEAPKSFWSDAWVGIDVHPC